MYDKIVFYDTETTGLLPNNYIVTLAYIYCEKGKEPVVGQIKCNPNYPISSAASKVNGITNEMAKDWPLFAEVWPQIEPYFRDSVWIGYNSDRFDWQGVRLELKRYGCKEPHHWNLDVLDIAKVMVPSTVVANHKLITMCKHFGIEGENFHTSDFDTWGTKELFKKLVELNKNGREYDKYFVPWEVIGAYTGETPPCLVEL